MADLQGKTVAILGYGNQGRAQALNLRDSGVNVVIGARPGRGATQAETDGFTPIPFSDAVMISQVVCFLLPDQVISEVFKSLQPALKGKHVGFSHGFAYVFGDVPKDPEIGYFLAGPKGAGALLRQEYLAGPGLPGVFAVESKLAETREIALAYCKAVGIANRCLIETSFREETECDLFGEQVVLCGGIPRMMEMAFDTLVANGHSPEMAFFECCYEARLILELWMKNGPGGLSKRISPTAFYGGLERAKDILPEESSKKEFQKIFDSIRSGAFAKELMKEASDGFPVSKAEQSRLSQTLLEETYQKLKDKI